MCTDFCQEQAVQTKRILPVKGTVAIAQILQRPPCAKGAPALAGEGLYCYHFVGSQIGSITHNPSVSPYGEPPPLAQGRLKL